MVQSKTSRSTRSARSQRPRKTRWALLVVVTGCLVFFLVDGVNYASGVFLDTQKEEFQVDPFVISFVASISRAVFHFSAIFVGPLANKLGCSTVCMISFVLGGVFLTVSSYAINVGFLCISYGVFVGASFCGTEIPCLICATMYFRKHRGLAVGVITAGSGLGAFAFSPVSDFLIAHIGGWRVVYKVYTALFVIGIIPAAFLKPQSPKKTIKEYVLAIRRLWQKIVREANNCCRNKTGTEEPPSEESFLSIEEEDYGEEEEEEEENDMVVHPATAPHPRSGRPGRLGEAKEELKKMGRMYQDHCIILSSLAGFISTCGIYVPTVYLVSYANSLNIQEDTSLLLSFMGIANMLSRLILGWFIDLKYLNTVVVYCLGTFLGGASTLVIWKYNSYPALVTYSFVYGFSFGCNISLMSVVLVQLMGLESFHQTFGIVSFWCGLGALCGAPSLGYLYKVTEQYYTVFLITGIVLSLGAFVWVMTPFVMSREEEGPIRVYLAMSPDSVATAVTSEKTVSGEAGFSGGPTSGSRVTLKDKSSTSSKDTAESTKSVKDKSSVSSKETAKSTSKSTVKDVTILDPKDDKS